MNEWKKYLWGGWRLRYSKTIDTFYPELETLWEGGFWSDMSIEKLSGLACCKNDRHKEKEKKKSCSREGENRRRGK